LFKSFNVVFELSVNNPTGVLRKTIPVFIRHTAPFNVIEGSVSTGTAGEGGASGAGACAGGTSDSVDGPDWAAASAPSSVIMASVPAKHKARSPGSQPIS